MQAGNGSQVAGCHQQQCRYTQALRSKPMHVVISSVGNRHAVHLAFTVGPFCTTRLTLLALQRLQTCFCRPCCWLCTCGLPYHSLSYATSSFCQLVLNPRLQGTSLTLTHPQTWLALQLQHSLQKSIYRSCCLFCEPAAAVTHAYTACGPPYWLCYCQASLLSRCECASVMVA